MSSDEADIDTAFKLAFEPYIDERLTFMEMRRVNLMDVELTMQFGDRQIVVEALPGPELRVSVTIPDPSS